MPAVHFTVDPVRRVYDTVLRQDVWLLGGWHDEAGQVVSYEVATLTARRSPEQLSDPAGIPLAHAGPAAPVRAYRDD